MEKNEKKRKKKKQNKQLIPSMLYFITLWICRETQHLRFLIFGGEHVAVQIQLHHCWNVVIAMMLVVSQS